MTTADQRLLAFAGFGHDGTVARSHPEAFEYDAAGNAWKAAPALPELGRTQFGLAQDKDELWLFGGLDYDPRRKKEDQFRHERPVLKTSLSGDSKGFTTSGIELPGPRRAFAIATLGRKVVLVGGMRENFALVDDCVAYDLDTHKWSDFVCPNQNRLSGEMVAIGDRLFLASGSSRPTPEAKLAPNRSLEVYESTTNQWSVLVDELPIEAKHMRMFAMGQVLLAYNAHSEDDKIDLLVVDPGGSASAQRP